MNKVAIHCVVHLTLLFTTTNSYSQCNSSGFKLPGTVSNNTSSGVFSWSNTSNINTADNNNVTAGYTLGLFASVQSNNLMTQNFNMAIPLAVTICGIEVTVECDADGLGILGTSVKDQTVRLLKGGTMAGSNKANTGAWPSSQTTVTYGSSTDLWGTTWTSADINSTDFGVAFAVQLNSGALGAFLNANVDVITVNVYYQHIVLPNTVESFTASQKNNAVQLNWTLKRGHGVKEVVLERQLPNLNWQPLTSTKALTNKEEQLNFQSFDQHPLLSNNYRLKLTDANGHNTYSSCVSIKVNPAKPIVLTVNSYNKQVVVTSEKPVLYCNVYNSYGMLLKSIRNHQRTAQMKIPFSQLTDGYVLLKAFTEQGGEAMQLYVKN